MNSVHLPRCATILLFLALLVPAVAGNQGQTWTINLKDADLGEFITQVSRISGRNFVVDPRVKGRVTVISSAALDADGVYELFQSVLRVHGFAAVPAGDVVRIVQQTLAKQSASGQDFDPTSDGEIMVTRVIPATNVASSELVKILRPLIPQYSHVASVDQPNVVILSDHAENIRRMEAIIREIDVAQDEIVTVIPLKEAWVENMVELLQALAPNQIGRNATGPQAVQVVANARNNSLVLRGNPASITELRALIGQLDQPATVLGSTQVFRLSHGSAEQLAVILADMLSDQDDANGRRMRTSVKADTSLNALVVRADPATMVEVTAILDQLDVRRTQVLIEAAIVEVSINNRRNIGVDLAAVDRDGSTIPLIVSPLGQALQSLLGPALASGDDSDLLTGAANVTSPTLAVARLSSGVSFAAILQAIGTHSDSDLLSTPSILTLDNEEATIIVGQNVPFRTGSFTTTGTGAQNPFTTIQREDVGITLRVIPHIHDGDAVRLEVEQEVSSVESGAQVGDQSFSDIVTNKRTIRTTILADDGQTIVLGGLIQDDIQESGRKVPFLGDLPLAGRLFRSSSTERTKRNLLVFLRPTILRTPDDVASVSDRKYRSVWEVQTRRRDASRAQGEEEDEETPDIQLMYQGGHGN
ncbi:MAG: type II secretion system secretin GspD [Gammaproteobacteria bacterium]|nr:type II secretion system secretin GspD [Gammaproteobacteria bacterium]